MKGGTEPHVVLLSVVMVLLFLSLAAVGMNKAFGEKGLYDKFSRPILWGSEELMKIGADKYLKQNEEFLGKVNEVFSGNPIETKCSQWYRDCGGTVTGLWNSNPNLNEFDFDRVNVLCSDKKSDARENIREAWIKSSDSFSELSDMQQFDAMKNACAVNLLNQIHEKEQAENQG